MTSKYEIKRITLGQAENIWCESPQATVFTHPYVLSSLSGCVHWWGVTKGEEFQCVWPITLNKENEIQKTPFSYWQGPLWSRKGYFHPTHRTLSVTTSVYNLFIDRFIREYGKIEASLHPTLLDVRAFDWWNYHESDKPRFKIRPRYTAVLSGLNSQSFRFEKGYRELRRREIRKAGNLRNYVSCNADCSAEELFHLYRVTLEIGTENQNKIDSNISVIYQIATQGFGWVQALRMENGSLASALLILADRFQANLVINLVHPEFRTSGLMALNIHQAIKEAKDRGLVRFDFNGANSPKRGDDKHSYGAAPELYFDLIYPS